VSAAQSVLRQIFIIAAPFKLRLGPGTTNAAAVCMSLALTFQSVGQAQSLLGRRRSREHRGAARWGAALLVTLCALAPAAQAQFSGSASANAQYENNSNVFYVTSGYVPPPNTDFHRADSFYAYGAELAGDYLVSRQQLYARVSGKEFN